MTFRVVFIFVCVGLVVQWTTSYASSTTRQTSSLYQKIVRQLPFIALGTVIGSFLIWRKYFKDKKIRSQEELAQEAKQYQIEQYKKWLDYVRIEEPEEQRRKAEEKQKKKQEDTEKFVKQWKSYLGGDQVNFDAMGEIMDNALSLHVNDTVVDKIPYIITHLYKNRQDLQAIEVFILFFFIDFYKQKNAFPRLNELMEFIVENVSEENNICIEVFKKFNFFYQCVLSKSPVDVINKIIDIFPFFVKNYFTLPFNEQNESFEKNIFSLFSYVVKSVKNTSDNERRNIKLGIIIEILKRIEFVRSAWKNDKTGTVLFESCYNLVDFYTKNTTHSKEEKDKIYSIFYTYAAELLSSSVMPLFSNNTFVSYLGNKRTYDEIMSLFNTWIPDSVEIGNINDTQLKKILLFVLVGLDTMLVVDRDETYEKIRNLCIKAIKNYKIPLFIILDQFEEVLFGDHQEVIAPVFFDLVKNTWPINNEAFVAFFFGNETQYISPTKYQNFIKNFSQLLEEKMSDCSSTDFTSLHYNLEETRLRFLKKNDWYLDACNMITRCVLSVIRNVKTMQLREQFLAVFYPNGIVDIYTGVTIGDIVMIRDLLLNQPLNISSLENIPSLEAIFESSLLAQTQLFNLELLNILLKKQKYIAQLPEIMKKVRQDNERRALFRDDNFSLQWNFIQEFCIQFNQTQGKQMLLNTEKNNIIERLESYITEDTKRNIAKSKITSYKVLFSEDTLIQDAFIQLEMNKISEDSRGIIQYVLEKIQPSQNDGLKFLIRLYDLEEKMEQ